MSRGVRHVRGDALSQLAPEELERMAQDLRAEQVALRAELSSLIDVALEAIDAGDADTIERTFASRDQLTARMKAVEMARAAVALERDRGARPTDRDARRAHILAREGYAAGIAYAYAKLTDVDPRAVSVTWRTRAEEEEVQRAQQAHLEGLAKAPLAGRAQREAAEAGRKAREQRAATGSTG